VVDTEEIEVNSTAGIVVVPIAEQKRDRWSPRLQLNWKKTEDGGSPQSGAPAPSMRGGRVVVRVCFPPFPVVRTVG